MSEQLLWVACETVETHLGIFSVLRSMRETMSATRVAIEARANFLAGLKLMAGSAASGPRHYRLEVRLRRPWYLRPLMLTDIGEVNIDR